MTATSLGALGLLVTAVNPGVVPDPQQKTAFRQVHSQVLVEHAGGMPALCRADNGDLLFAHARYWEPVPTGGDIVLRRSRDGGRTWGEPHRIVEPKGPDWNATTWSGLHRVADGSLIFTFNQSWTPRAESVAEGEVNPARIWDIGSETCRYEAYVIRSTDHGHTWGPPTRILPDLGQVWIFGRPVNAADGSVLAPVIPSIGGHVASGLVRSTDLGRTWGPLEMIAGGPLRYNEVTLGIAGDGDDRNRNEDNHTIVAVFRDCEAGPRRQFRQAFSTDHGRTWSSPQLIDLWGKMPDMLTLPDGRLLMAVGSVDCMDGALVFSGPPGSSYAQLFISHDHGRTWQRDVLLTSMDPDQIIPFDAPTLASLDDGRVLAISFACDRRNDGDPLIGWSQGMHYVIHVLEPVAD